MRGAHRAWRWIGGAWLLLVVAGAALTMALTPTPAADAGSGDGRDDVRPATTQTPEPCLRDFEEAREDTSGPPSLTYVDCTSITVGTE